MNLGLKFELNTFFNILEESKFNFFEEQTSQHILFVVPTWVPGDFRELFLIRIATNG